MFFYFKDYTCNLTLYFEDCTWCEIFTATWGAKILFSQFLFNARNFHSF